jgi:hypothetical protein
MNESFELPVQLHNETIMLPAALQSWGYSHRILVTVDDQEIVFEPDEERNYRALVPGREKALEPELLKAIAEGIETAFK